jgi:P27 family predicted phage terminase small subunit
MAAPSRLPAPPKHLRPESRALWRKCVNTYFLEPHHLSILEAACQSMDRMTEARETIDRDGPYVLGRFGMKSHPALAVERDSRTAMLRALRELNLDAEAPATPRPPSRYRST